MGEWKRIAGHFIDAKSYSFISESPSGDTWCARQKAGDEILLVAGFVNNFEMPVIRISCRKDEKMFHKIEPLIQKVISCSPNFAPFSLIPIGDKVNGQPVDGMQMRRRLEILVESLEKKHPPSPITVVVIEKKEKVNKSKARNGQYTNADLSTMTFRKADRLSVAERQIPFEATDVHEKIEHERIEEAVDETLSAPAVVVETIEPIADELPESEPVRERRIEMTKDEYLDYMTSLNFESPSIGKSNIDYDLRLIVFNPGMEDKKGKSSNGVSPESIYQYKVSFGKFFTERNLNFKDVLIGARPDGKNGIEIALLFDNEMLRKEKTNHILPLPTATVKGAKVMAVDSTRKDLGATLVMMGKLSINKVVNTNTIFKWQVWPIAVKDVPAEANKNFKLLDVVRETFKADALTAIDPKPKTDIENNPNE